jgi:flagellar motor switch protein FliN
MERNSSVTPDEEARAGRDGAGGDNLGWDDVMEDLDQAKEAKPAAPPEPRPATEVSRAEFPEMTSGGEARGTLDLDFILDIPLTLTAELGRTRLLISELLQLGQGSVIELTKLAGEPMDIFVNQRLLARGEVVVVNEKFGVRLTDIVSQAERVTRLR